MPALRSMDNLFRLCKGKPFCVFSDLDYTCCLAGNKTYARENKKSFGIDDCFIVPDAAKAFLRLHDKGCPVFFVTGRHWDGRRKEPENQSVILDGALNDLLGGKHSPFAAFDAVAAHGRQIVENGKTRTLRRSSCAKRNREERLFERFANERMRETAQDIGEIFPDAAPYIRRECKKHLCYINIINYPEGNKERFGEIFSYMKEQTRFILEGRDRFGRPIKDAPPNPNGIFVSAFDDKGSVDIRSRSYNKGRALIRSGFLDKAFNTGCPVLAAGDSLAGNGTDRDMFLCLKSYFAQKNASDRLFLIQVLKREKERLNDPNDPCLPDIVLHSPDELGKVILSLSD